MTDEEKRAINRIYDVTHQVNGSHVNYIDINNICTEENELDSCEGFCKATDIVLNLIKKQSKMIDLMAEQLTSPINDKEWVIKFYEKEAEKNNG